MATYPETNTTGAALEHIPTSQLFPEILSNAPAETVTLAWIVRSLRRRSFGMIMLLLGLIAMFPGISVLAGLLLTPVGFQMMMAREVPTLPRVMALRPISTHQIALLIRRSIPAIKMLERFIRPRWHTPFLITKRVVGSIVLMLAITLFVPIPFSNIVPGAATMLIALAYLEEDGVFLCVALGAGLVSLVATAFLISAALDGTGILLRL